MISRVEFVLTPCFVIIMNYSKIFFTFCFQPVHMPVNRLFGNLQIPGYFMSAIPLDLHQNDLKGKPVHGDQHMIQFLILNTIQKVLYCFQFSLDQWMLLRYPDMYLFYHG